MRLCWLPCLPELAPDLQLCSRDGDGLLRSFRKQLPGRAEWHWGAILCPNSHGLFLQEILKEGVTPHMASIGSVTFSASGPAQYIAKMFR